MFGGESNATFFPGSPGRTAELFVWPAAFGIDEADLVVPSGDRIRTRTVRGVRYSIDRVLDDLVPLGVDAPVSRSVRAWAEIARVALRFIAEGHLRLGVVDGSDAWSIGSLGPHERSALAALAAWLPPEAHCVPVPDTRPARMLGAAPAVAEFVSAIADVMPRTAAAGLVSGQRAWVGDWLSDVSDLARFLPDAVEAPDTVVGLRLVMPDGADAPFVVDLALRSADDPTREASAAEMWRGQAPHLGPKAENDLLVALHRGARIWSPLGRLLDEPEPSSMELFDTEAVELFDLADDLARAGIELLLPGTLVDALTATARVEPPPGAGDGPSRFDLNSLCQLTWSASLQGEPLTDAELSMLAATSRPLVKLRNQWVVADPAVIAKLSETQEISAAEALAAALGGTTMLGGQEISVEAAGPLADITTRLAFANDPHELAEPVGLHAELRPYQRRGLAWLADMTMLGLGGVLADDMGLGKTVQFIALHLHLMNEGLCPGPTLVVCPASVVGNWERELARFAPDLDVRRYHGTGRTLAGIDAGDIVVTTYGVVRRDQFDLGLVQWGLIAADEAQQIKNPNSGAARAMRTLSAGARVALTGTPVENRLTELWSLIDWTTPGLLGSVERFRRDIAIPIERDRDPEVTRRFGAVISPFLLRRRKDDPEIAPDLPPKTETDHPVALTAEQARLYKAVVDDVMDAVSNAAGIERRGLVLKLLTALKQVCNHPAHYLAESGPLADRSGKLDAFADLVSAIADAGDSTLVFTQYVKMGELLLSELAHLDIPAQFLHGSLSLTQRETMVDRFQAGEFPVLVISLRAGGTGLNLTRATHVVHYDRWWNPAVENQASDRAWRIGQDRPVQVHRLICTGTLEERIAEVLEAKSELADAVVGSGEAWLTELDDDQLSDLIGLGEQPEID
ncbi:MAG: DEAD/DEAH box helicase [Acidimicrobiales bacterium]